jgi:hypothetical protein
MTESKVFMSSCSRRELARRRQGRSPHTAQFMAVMLVLMLCAAAFVIGSGRL